MQIINFIFNRAENLRCQFLRKSTMAYEQLADKPVKRTEMGAARGVLGLYPGTVLCSVNGACDSVERLHTHLHTHAHIQVPFRVHPHSYGGVLRRLS